MKKIEYSCLDCANQGTPICKVCDCIVTVNGRVLQKPKYFVGVDFRKGLMNEASKVQKASAKQYIRGMKGRIRKGLPLPILQLMMYNDTVAMKYKEEE